MDILPVTWSFTTSGTCRFFPLTSRIVRDYLVAILAEPTHLVLWSARRMTGWIEALMENAPQTFRSDLPEEHMIALQNM
jgi:hypothetical protein